MSEQDKQDQDKQDEPLLIGDFASWLRSTVSKKQAIHLSLGGQQWEVSWNDFPVSDDDGRL